MNISLKKIKTSTVFAVLVFISSEVFPSAIRNDKLYFPLTENPEFSMSSSYYAMTGFCITPDLLLPVSPGICLDFRFDVIYGSNSERTVLGDAEIGIDVLLPFNTDFFNTALSFSVLLPNGPDSSQNSDFMYLSFGRDMLTAAFLSMLSFRAFSLYSNIRYNFISNSNDLYDGIYLNPVSKKTYENLFGLNMMNSDSFLYSKNIKDDFLVFDSSFLYKISGSLFAGISLFARFCWDEETSVNTGFGKSACYGGGELIFSPKGIYGLKLIYLENSGLYDSSPDRFFMFSMFTEI